MNRPVSNYMGSGLLLLFFVFTSFYCSRPAENKKTAEGEISNSKTRIDNLAFKSPLPDKAFTIGNDISISLITKDPSLKPDSIQLFVRANQLETLATDKFDLEWTANPGKVGRTPLRALAFYGDTLTETKTVNITLLSDIKPGKVNYRIVNEFPHDPEAFTQGLVYYNGFLFESTGQYGKSTVRKVDIETGKVLQINQLGQEFFGEGLAIYNSKLLQLTWKEQVGFIYDMESFSMLQKVYYDIKEGWGLTYDGNEFVLSDGTSRLYFMDPTYFTETGRLEIYDDKGMVPYLNELEYIDGRIFANIWGKEIIAVLDPNNGKVTHYLDFSGSVPANIKNSGDKVLNGIAYNPETGNLYITGKYWPVLFELEYSLEP